MHLAHNDHLLLRAIIISAIILMIWMNYLPQLIVNISLPGIDRVFTRSRIEIGRKLIDILGIKTETPYTYPPLDSKLYHQERGTSFVYPPGSVGSYNPAYLYPPLGI